MTSTEHLVQTGQREPWVDTLRVVLISGVIVVHAGTLVVEAALLPPLAPPGLAASQRHSAAPTPPGRAAATRPTATEACP